MSPLGGRGRSVDRFEFDPADLARLLEVLAWLSANRDGWLNLLPGLETPSEPGESPGLFSIFGSSQTPVSMCTWMPPGRGRHAPDEVTVGIMHGRGTKVIPDLDAAGLAIAPSWRVWGDHPRRGLVVRIPTTAPDSQVLGWALAAGAHLCSVPTTGSWQAEVYQPMA
ncbi:MAG: hypothetical protein ACRDVW_02735 [Acidimicrobiales bacterium]